MKRTLKYISLVLLVSLSSCTDWLDLRPESEVVLEDFWQTESQATAVLSSCYRGLQSDACVERMLIWGELRSDNLVAGNSINTDLLKIINVNITSTNYYTNWAPFYSVINYCNTFLYFAPPVVERDQNFTVSKLHNYESEVLTIRAMCYFYLVRAFKEVPLVLTPSISDTTNYNRSKSSERVVLDQIISDLKTAEQYARLSYGKGAYNKGRITLNAIYALLADVYLWDKQYDNCIEMCNNIINDKTYVLVDGEKLLNEVFYKGNSTESIFELQYNKDIQYNNTVNYFFGYEGNKFGVLSFPAYLTRTGNFKLFNYSEVAVKESTDDIREKNFFGSTDYGTGYPIYKYALNQCIKNADETVTPVYRSSATTVNWVIYRLADIVLMKSEALVSKQNATETDFQEALRMVNKTYLRSNPTADSLLINNYSSQSAMESLVLRERQRELMFEGKRWFDLVRLARRRNDATAILAYISPKLAGDNMQMNKLSVMDGLYMPVIQSEIEINPNIKQNPFYEEETAQ